MILQRPLEEIRLYFSQRKRADRHRGQYGKQVVLTGTSTTICLRPHLVKEDGSEWTVARLSSIVGKCVRRHQTQGAPDESLTRNRTVSAPSLPEKDSTPFRATDSAHQARLKLPHVVQSTRQSHQSHHRHHSEPHRTTGYTPPSSNSHPNSQHRNVHIGDANDSGFHRSPSGLRHSVRFPSSHHNDEHSLYRYMGGWEGMSEAPNIPHTRHPESHPNTGSTSAPRMPNFHGNFQGWNDTGSTAKMFRADWPGRVIEHMNQHSPSSWHRPSSRQLKPPLSFPRC